MMFYSKFIKKILAGTLITACSLSCIPSKTILATSTNSISIPGIHSEYNAIPNQSILNDDIAQSIATPLAVTTGSVIDADAASDTALDTPEIPAAPVTKAALKISVQKKVSLYPNEKKKLKTKVKNNSTKVKYSFKSKKPSVVKINSKTGKMTAKKAGTTTIVTKISVNRKKYTRKTKVTVIDAYLSFTNATVMLNRGQSFQFKVKKHNIKKAVVWSVDNPNLASIDKKSGKLVGKSRGTVLVTATCGSLQKSMYVSIR